MQFLAAAAFLVRLLAGFPEVEMSRTTAEFKRLTPILFVQAIEPALPFWEDALGFTRSAEVPEGDRLGFVILQKDGVEVMYQTRASLEADLPDVAARQPVAGTVLFVEVSDVDDVERALREYETIAPRRTTEYGAEEIVLREPGGNIVVFAQFGS